MDEGRKRVLAIVAGILVARHLKTTDDLFDSRSSPMVGESEPCTRQVWRLRLLAYRGAFRQSALELI
jgi:hypothetical protein